MRLRLLVLCALLVVVGAWGLLYVWRTSFLVSDTRVFSLWDDSMVSMRYARNLAAGHGLVWNPGGERVQGITNLGVTLVMALTHLLPIGAERVALACQVLALACLLGILRLLSDVTRLLTASAWAGVVAVAVGALCAPLALWTLQGSDVGPVTLVLLLALQSLLSGWRADRPWPWAVFTWVAVGVVVRLDLLVVGVALLAVGLLTGADRLRLAGAAALLGATAGAVLLFGRLYYGDALPNTYYLKATGAPLRLVWAVGLDDTLRLLGQISPFLLVACALGLWRPARRGPGVLACAAVVTALVLYNAVVGADWKRHDYLSRFVVPALPLLVALLVTACHDLAHTFVAAAPRRAGVLVALAALAAAPQLSPTTAWREWLQPDVPTMDRATNQKNAAMGLYFKASTEPDTRIAVHWAGVPAYFADRPCVDLLGKSDRHIARMVVNRFYPGHSKWDWDYVLERLKPDVIMEATRGLDRDPRFLRDYLKAMNGAGAPFLVRRDSLGKLRDPVRTFPPNATSPS